MIAKKLNVKGKLSRNAIAEGIINNVRKTIIRDRLTDPRFYEQMSKLLDDLIKQSREDATEYEAFLKNAEAMVQQMAKKNTGAHPASLNNNAEAIVLFNNLATIEATTFTTFQSPADENEKAALALELDFAIRERAPAGWKSDSNGPRGAQVLNALFPLLSKDRVATKALFDIILKQAGY